MILPFRASVSRLSPETADGNKRAYSLINNSISIDIQPANAELTAISEGRLGQTFRAFTTYSGVCIGDRVTVSGISENYSVKGVDNWNYGPLPHYELVLFKGDR